MTVYKTSIRGRYLRYDYQSSQCMFIPIVYTLSKKLKLILPTGNYKILEKIYYFFSLGKYKYSLMIMYLRVFASPIEKRRPLTTNINVRIIMTFNPSTNLKQVNELECSSPKLYFRSDGGFCHKTRCKKKKKLLSQLPQVKNL